MRTLVQNQGVPCPESRAVERTHLLKPRVHSSKLCIVSLLSGIMGSDFSAFTVQSVSALSVHSV